MREADGSASEEQLAAVVADEVQENVYSKDYWDNVFEQVGKRPLVKVALGLLALLYGSAIYAPLIANDRPYYLEGVNTKGYEKSTKIVYGATSGVRALLRKSKQEWEAAASERDTGFKVWEEAIENETTVLFSCLDAMRDSLDESDHGRLNSFESMVKDAVKVAESGDKDGALALIDEARDRSQVHKD